MDAILLLLKAQTDRKKNMQRLPVQLKLVNSIFTMKVQIERTQRHIRRMKLTLARTRERIEQSKSKIMQKGKLDERTLLLGQVLPGGVTDR